MEIIKKENKITIKHLLKKNETYKISKGNRSESIHIFKKPQLMKGYSNSCEDGLAVLFLDYDNCSREVVLEDYRQLQDRFNIMQGYLFKTKENNYHVVCIQKFGHLKVYEIVGFTRCDENYQSMPKRNVYRNYVLRISNKKGSKKPKFDGLIGEERFSRCEISSAHFKLLNKLYPKIENPTYYNHDNLNKLQLQEYETK